MSAPPDTPSPLHAGQRTRRLPASVRARVGLRVAQIAATPRPSRRAIWTRRWAPIGALALALIGAILLRRRPIEDVAPTAAAVPEREFRVPAPPPGRGDVCGARVCALEPDCCDRGWDARCDAKLLELGRQTGNLSQAVGRCYYHDRTFCPDCACPYYVKLSDTLNGGGIGYDSGTGCVNGDAGALAEAFKGACASAFCEVPW